VTKFNVDESSRTPAQYGIMAIPTLIIFKDGQEVDRVVEALPKSVLKGKVEAVL